VVVENGASDEKLLRWEMDGGKSYQIEELLSGELGVMGWWLGEVGHWLSDPWP